MSTRIEFTPQARDDTRAAYAWYERQSPGLGDRFLKRVDECLEVIQANPELFEIAYKQYRRAIVRRFPYVDFYKQEARRSSPLDLPVGAESSEVAPAIAVILRRSAAN